jgi:hypothetical protein
VKDTFYPMEDLYERGIAIGCADIRTDTVTFKYFNEEFTFPTMRAAGIMKYTGYWYEADIEDVRKLAGSMATH